MTIPEAGLEAHDDAQVLAFAKHEQRVLLTRNVRDFQALHEADDNHADILVEHQDRDPSKNLSAADVVRAISNIEVCRWEIARQLVSLIAWNDDPPCESSHER